MDDRIQCHSQGSLVVCQNDFSWNHGSCHELHGPWFMADVSRIQWKDTQISVVYTAILSGGQIGGIISGFLGEGFYTCSKQTRNLTSNSIDNKNPFKRALDEQTDFLCILNTINIITASVGICSKYLSASSYLWNSISFFGSYVYDGDWICCSRFQES